MDKTSGASAPRYCDLVFKGGITSGIVFPDVALKLHAEGFHFKSIGGASVGALVAGAVAAAELGERRAREGKRADGQGHDGLRAAAEAIAAKGFIAKLFQPAPALRPAFDALLEYLDRKGEQDAAAATAPPAPSGRFARAVGAARSAWTVIRVAGASVPRREAAASMVLPPVLLLAILLLALFGMVPAWVAVLLGLISAGTLAGSVCLLMWRSASTLALALQRNNFGLCSGLRMPRRRVPALTDWMHLTFNRLAGVPEDRVLLLKDLWAAPKISEEERDAAPGQVVTLITTTTDLSHSEPHLLPFVAGSGAFYWKRRELAMLFPKPVIKHMVKVARRRDAARPGKSNDHAPWIAHHDGEELYRFPEGGDVPVVVMARMSLSFPMLLSAVPLHEAVWEPASRDPAPEPATLQSAGRLPDAPIEGGTAPAFRRCWFSDGGICDNFPIDIFDAALPRWPTFGINLFYPEQPGAAADLRMPRANEDWGRTLNEIDGETGFGALQRFLWAILDSARNWNYLLQSRAPGTRDRIVHIGMMKNEGGMNIDMPPRVTKALRERGAQAGAKIVGTFDMDAHYWTRFRVASDALARHAEELTGRLEEPAPLQARRAYDRARGGPGTPDEPALPYAYGVGHERAIQILRGDLTATVGRMSGVPNYTSSWLSENTPRPLQSLRLRGKR